MIYVSPIFWYCQLYNVTFTVTAEIREMRNVLNRKFHNQTSMWHTFCYIPLANTQLKGTQMNCKKAGKFLLPLCSGRNGTVEHLIIPCHTLCTGYYCCATNYPKLTAIKQQSIYYTNGFYGIQKGHRLFLSHIWFLDWRVGD